MIKIALHLKIMLMIIWNHVVNYNQLRLQIIIILSLYYSTHNYSVSVLQYSP